MTETQPTTAPTPDAPKPAVMVRLKNLLRQAVPVQLKSPDRGQYQIMLQARATSEPLDQNWFQPHVRELIRTKKLELVKA